ESKSRQAEGVSANLTTSSDTATKKTSERAQKRSNAIFGSGQGFVRFFVFWVSRMVLSAFPRGFPGKV
ncbi:hypothetical protein RBH38_26720, partial [Escherichia coli]|uniref:hypothetical protein n=1 Tax=Escherichia coli TaxID=562 RepID=UPI002FC6DD71